PRTASAGTHRAAAAAEDPAWPHTLALHGLPLRMSDNPRVMPNHATATAMVPGPAAGLERLAALDADGRLKGHHRLDAVRAHLLELAGDRAAAVECYRTAARRTTSTTERKYLLPQTAPLAQRT